MCEGHETRPGENTHTRQNERESNQSPEEKTDRYRMPRAEKYFVCSKHNQSCIWGVDTLFSPVLFVFFVSGAAVLRAFDAIIIISAQNVFQQISSSSLSVCLSSSGAMLLGFCHHKIGGWVWRSPRGSQHHLAVHDFLRFQHRLFYHNDGCCGDLT